MVDNNEYMRIVKKYREPLFRYCYYRLFENKTLAEETFNDIIYILYQKWDTLDINSNIRAYLYRAADNCIKHNLKKYNKYYLHNASLEEAVEKNLFEYAVHNDDYFKNDEHSTEEYLERIRQALPEDYKAIYVYRYIEKKTLMEISAITDIPYSSLRLRIDKIEKMIRNEIKKIFS